MNIFELTAEMAEIEALLEENGGEITEEIARKMNLNEENIAEKVDQYAALIRKKKAEVAVIDEEVKRLQAIKKVKANTSKRVAENLLNAMQACGRTKLEGQTCKAYTRSSTSIEVDEDMLTAPYLSKISEIATTLPAYLRVTYSISKEALSDMEELPEGAQKVTRASVVLK